LQHGFGANRTAAIILTVHNTSNATLGGSLRTVFLDRDGVINEKMPEGQYVRSLQDFHLLPGVPEAIARLNQAGLRVIVVSNQRGVSLGLYTSADVDAIHAGFQELLAAKGAHVDAFYYCPHDKAECNCHKPLPGLFEQAQADFSEIDAATSIIVGDALSDIEFGRRLGMRTIFIEVHPDRQRPGADKARASADRCANSLQEAVDALLSGRA
jgi:D-glycero-D-manno-heptose 1,7-bisphosphate phosphatase